MIRGYLWIFSLAAARESSPEELEKFERKMQESWDQRRAALFRLDEKIMQDRPAEAIEERWRKGKTLLTALHKGVLEDSSQSQIYNRGWVSLACFGKLWRARSRLYRSQILQINTRWKALAEIYTMHSNGLLCTALESIGEKWGKKGLAKTTPKRRKMKKTEIQYSFAKKNVDDFWLKF